MPLYTPTATYHDSVTIPDDSAAPTASAFNPGLEGALDNAAYLKALLDRFAASPATNATTSAVMWTSGADDHFVELTFWGGGGGGGGGSAGDSGSDAANGYGCSGAGGGAPLQQKVVVAISPSTTYDLVAGAGGTAGTAGTGSTPGGDGGDGGDTIFRVHGGSTLATAKGGKGGKGGSLFGGTSVAPTETYLAPGGTPVAMTRPAPFKITGADLESRVSQCHGPGFGGDGVTTFGVQVTRQGADSIEGHTGGAGGTMGAPATFPGGGGGGGGAAGPGGPGGTGGPGGAGVSSGAGNNAGIFGGGFAGGGGGGGGGGGAGGSGSLSGGNGAAGTAGDTGFISLRVVG